MSRTGLDDPMLRRMQFAPMRNVQVFFYHGAAGTGKSHTVHQETGGRAYFKDEDKWWTHYEDEETIVFDDFRGHKGYHIIDEILDWTNPRQSACTVNTRWHGPRWSNWTKVYIISNMEFHELYPNASQEQLAALEDHIPPENRRRFVFQHQLDIVF